jgi:predicted dehydrogenase/flavin reductase (DIM6/NTAB) family NADH-FMN oxidoreductase RutF
MHWPGRTIWDTRIQSACAILSAQGELEVEIYFTATFAQVSFSPPRVMVNPNRMYAIEDTISKTGRLAINVLPLSSKALLLKLVKMRRRQPDKAKLLGLGIELDHHQIPYLNGCLQTIFCEVEQVIPSGDRRLYLTRVIEARSNPQFSGQRPLLFSDLVPTRFPALRQSFRKVLAVSGGLDAIKKAKERLRPSPPADIAKTTYEMAGSTESELETVNSFGLVDRGRQLVLPRAPAIVKKAVGVCVVGTGWGAFHCQVIKRASSSARLFVCGQNEERTARLAKAVNAEGYFIGIDQAANDSRVQCLSLALPHDLHRQAVEISAAAGKHALVEKPIATTLIDADAMIDSVRRAGTFLMVAEDMHFRPAIREAVERIERGDIGEPLYFLAHAAGIRRPRGWGASAERMGGGVLMDFGVHYVRSLRLLMGEPDRAFASKAMQIDTKIAGDDSVQVFFSSKVGWEGHMLLSWSSLRGHVPDIIVSGDSGSLHLWPGTNFIDYYPVAPPLLPRLLSYVRPYWLQEKLMRPQFGRVRVKLSDKEGSGYLGEMKEFLAAVADNRPPLSPPEDGRRDLEIVLSAYQSLYQRIPVDIPPG